MIPRILFRSTLASSLLIAALAHAQQPPASGGAPADPAAASQPAPPPPPPPPTTGNVSVTATPAGAAVAIDGKPATGSVELKAGSHKIRVTLAGHHPWDGSVAVVAGKDHVVQVELKPVPPPPKKPTLTLGFDLEESTVLIDGAEVQIEQGEPLEVAAGSHTVVVRKKGFKDWTATADYKDAGAVTYGTFEAEAEDDGLGPYVTMGLGVGLIALGTVFGSEGADESDQRTNEVSGINNEDDRKTASLVLFTVGGALIATGVTLLIIDVAGEDEGTEESAMVAPYATPDGAGVAGIFRF